MKNFCDKNQYEFIVFDKKENIFYTHESNNSLKLIHFKTYIKNESLIKLTNIFQDKEEDFIILKKNVFK